MSLVLSQRYLETVKTSEKKIATKYLDRLSENFQVFEQVRGKHFSGKTLIIDAVIRPNNISNWKNKNVAFGIEFKDTKRFEKDFDFKDYSKWIAQCVDYANTKWEQFGYLYIITAPDLMKSISESKPELHDNIRQTNFIENIASQLGVFTLKEVSRNCLGICHNTRHFIWDEDRGVRDGKWMNLERVFGSK